MKDSAVTEACRVIRRAACGDAMIAAITNGTGSYTEYSEAITGTRDGKRVTRTVSVRVRVDVEDL